MKTIFIPAESIVDISGVVKAFALKEEIKNKRIGLITTIQHLSQFNKARKILKNAVVGGQILGCNSSNASKIRDKVDVFFFIGSGRFHPLKVALETGKLVYIANPFTNEISQISEEKIKSYKATQKGKLTKFLASKKIGIIVSTKPGQYNLRRAVKLQEKLEKQGKEPYLFLTNTILEQELENFKDIEYWVNTACPRIEMKGVIGIDELDG